MSDSAILTRFFAGSKKVSKKIVIHRQSQQQSQRGPRSRRSQVRRSVAARASSPDALTIGRSLHLRSHRSQRFAHLVLELGVRDPAPVRVDERSQARRDERLLDLVGRHGAFEVVPEVLRRDDVIGTEAVLQQERPFPVGREYLEGPVAEVQLAERSERWRKFGAHRSSGALVRQNASPEETGMNRAGGSSRRWGEAKMKRVIALRGTTIMLLLSLVGCGGRTGGEENLPVDPRFPADISIPVPENLVATASFKRLEVRWDAVPGATGYRLYLATAPGQPIVQMSPIDVSAPPFIDSAAPNWVTKYLRVAARVRDRQSRLSAEVSAAMPTAGWIVAEHEAGGATSVRIYHSDEPEAVIDEIPGARFDRIYDPSTGQMKIVRVGSIGVAWGIPAAVPTEFTELGVFASSQRATLGAQPGHTYKYFGLIPSQLPRAVFRDYDAGAITYALRSASLDGNDSRALKSGCSNIPGPADPMPPIFAAS